MCLYPLEVKKQDGELSSEDRLSCVSYIRSLQANLEKLRHYRVPAKFFGLGALAVENMYSNFYGLSNMVENVDDVSFIVKTDPTT